MGRGVFGRSRLVLWLLLVGMFSLGLGIRLYDLTDPPLDLHPTRQLRVAMISRGIYYQMNPSADAEERKTAIAFARSMGQYEPAIVERLVAYTYLLLGGERLWVSRIFTTGFWMIGGAALFALARRMSNVDGAFVATAFFLFIPFGILASRSFQPDPGMVMWIVLAAYLFYRWSETQRWGWAVLAGATSGVAVLVKVVAAYLVVGLAVALVISVLGIKASLKNPQVWTMAILMGTPAVVYYVFLLEGRSSEYFQNWTLALLDLVVRPSFYASWLVQLHNLIGLSVLFLGLLGVLLSKPLERAMLFGLWVGYGIYGLSLPYQVTTHSYYNLQLVPVVGLSLAPIGAILLSHLSNLKVTWKVAMIGLVVVSIMYPLWDAKYSLEAQDYRGLPSIWMEIGQSIPEDGKIIALTQDYGYPLMYYGWKKVDLWPNTAEQHLADLRGKKGKGLENEFEDRTKGKNYFLVTDFEQFGNQPGLKAILYEHYPVYVQGEGFLVFDLAHRLESNP